MSIPTKHLDTKDLPRSYELISKADLRDEAIPGGNKRFGVFMKTYRWDQSLSNKKAE